MATSTIRKDYQSDIDTLNSNIGNMNISAISSSTTIASLCSSCPAGQHRYYYIADSNTLTDFPSTTRMYRVLLSIHKIDGTNNRADVEIIGKTGSDIATAFIGVYENGTQYWSQLALNSNIASLFDCTRLTVGSVSDGTTFKARHSFTLPAGVWFVSVGMPWGNGRPDKYAIADNDSTFVNTFTSTTDNYYVHSGVIRVTQEKTYWVWASIGSASGNMIFDLLKIKVANY